MLHIHSISTHSLSLPFRVAFTHSLASRDRMASVLVKMTTAEGITGYGEGTPRGYVTGEEIKETITKLQSMAQSLAGCVIETVSDIDRLLSGPEYLSNPSARCALELAMLDILGKSHNLPVWELLGTPISEEIQYSSVISSDTPATVKQFLLQSAQLGLQQVKLKLGSDPDQNLAIVQMAKEILPQAELRADINAGWNMDLALTQIPKLAALGIGLFEQPLAVPDRALYPVLREKMQGIAEIMVDESIVSQTDAEWMYAHGGTDRFLLKISKMGGILPTLRLAGEARSHGIKSHLGCHVGESSLLSAAGRIAAAHFPFESVEGSFGTLLLEQDITGQPLQFGKMGLAPVAYSSLPGLGVDVLEDRIG